MKLKLGKFELNIDMEWNYSKYEFTHWWSYNKDIPTGIKEILWKHWWKSISEEQYNKCLEQVKREIKWNTAWSVKCNEEYKNRYVNDLSYYKQVLKYLEGLNNEDTTI